MRPSITRVGGFAFNGINNLYKEISKNYNIKITKHELYDLVYKECDTDKVIEKFKKLKHIRNKKLLNSEFWDFK